MNIELYKERRKQLLHAVQEKGSEGPILLSAAFEREVHHFRQDSTFYYFTGVTEPGAVCIISPDGKTDLFVPEYKADRSRWLADHVCIDGDPQVYGVDTIQALGKPVSGFTLSPFAGQDAYAYVLDALSAYMKKTYTVYAVMAERASLFDQVYRNNCLQQWLGDTSFHDIYSSVCQLRRKKSNHEIELMHHATATTITAQEAAAQAIAPGVSEAYVQAALEYVMTESGAVPSFPSIVASGSRSTILHYQANNRQMQSGELVVVDCGASNAYYCSDLTRTFPVSGSFTKRQREVYAAVLEAHDYVASCLKPGYYLKSDAYPEKSLHHLACEVLNKHGLSDYIEHGIGHFLGIDVHDAGDVTQPLEKDDVITIEPGVYIPEEQIGVRIEDDYWLIEDGAICMSQNLPRTIDEIEALSRRFF
jgi:Xaa-Pro aminopeptidase